MRRLRRHISSHLRIWTIIRGSIALRRQRLLRVYWLLISLISIISVWISLTWIRHLIGMRSWPIRSIHSWRGHHSSSHPSLKFYWKEFSIVHYIISMVPSGQKGEDDKHGESKDNYSFRSSNTLFSHLFLFFRTHIVKHGSILFIVEVSLSHLVAHSSRKSGN